MAFKDRIRDEQEEVAAEEKKKEDRKKAESDLDGREERIKATEKAKQLSLTDRYINKTNYAKEFDKKHDGMNKKWLNDQTALNKARMEANAAEVFDRAATMKAEMGKY